MKLFTTAFILFSIILFSCSSGISVTNVTEDNKRVVDTAIVVSQKEFNKHLATKVGDLILTENSNLDWNPLHKKLIDKAKANGANIVVVNNIGYNLKGHQFYLEGELYYSESPVVNENSGCKLAFIRNRFESILGSAFKMKVKVENLELGELKKEKSLAYNSTNCDANLNVLINNEKYEIALNGRSRYYLIGRQTSGGSTGVGVQVAIGGISVSEIENEELGRLLYLQNK